MSYISELVDNNSKSEILLPDIKDHPIISLCFLDYSFQMLFLTLRTLSGTLLLILGDLHSNTLFFEPIFGGDPIFYHLGSFP